MREFLWEVGEEEIGPTTLYSLTTKPLLQPSIAVTKDKIRTNIIHVHPDLFKVVCQIKIDIFE